jgi:hypothetical protein
MSSNRRIPTPALALATALAPTALIVAVLIAAMLATDDAGMIISVGIVFTLGVFYTLRWWLLRRYARDRATEGVKERVS